MKLPILTCVHFVLNIGNRMYPELSRFAGAKIEYCLLIKTRSKNPSLVEGLEVSFSQCLSDLGRKCVDELEEYATLIVKMDEDRFR